MNDREDNRIQPSQDARHYRAFISYSHHDAADAIWLTRKLESWRVPRYFQASQTEKRGAIAKMTLGPIFRDRDELPAAHSLGEPIRQALANSDWLIVLCSPHSAQSKWVNEEVAEFTRLGKSKNILAVIIDGEPFGSETGKGPECFPENLRYRLTADGTVSAEQAEPCAADMRHGKDGRKLGFLKLAAGMLGVSLDDLIRRDLIRKNKTVTAVTAASLAGMIIMGLLAFTAWQGQREAQHQRVEAEGLIEFMLTDLRDKLEPVGRLDVLQVVADKAEAYYREGSDNRTQFSTQSNAAQVDRLIGELHQIRGHVEDAEQYFLRAYAKTLKIHTSAGKEAKFQHSQNAFALSVHRFFYGNPDAAIPLLEEHQSIVSQLLSYDQNDYRTKLVFADGEAYWGIINLKHTQNRALALTKFITSIELYRDLERLTSDLQRQVELKRLIADRLTGIADIYEQSKKFDLALEARREVSAIHEFLNGNKNETNWQVRKDEAFNQFHIATLYRKKHDLVKAQEILNLSFQEMNAVIVRDPENTIWKGYHEQVSRERGILATMRLKASINAVNSN